MLFRSKSLSKLTFFNTNYRFYINLNGEDYQKVIEILNTVVGLSSYSLCKRVKTNLEYIGASAIDIINYERRNREFSFKVETHRGDKSFPFTSIEISQKVASKIIPEIIGIKVDVHNPELKVSIDLRTEGTYIYTKVIKGLGGYPSGVAGRGLLMISGGIDSPVAGFLCLKKGVNLNAIHYASPPHTSDMALQKVIDLLERIAHYNLDGKINLYVVGFTDIQNKINKHANNIYSVTLMRRQMYKIADRFAREHGYDCMVNGESIGQVASQTLESMMVVNEVTSLPIIRPLATYDKEEIINISRQIKTFDISIQPYEDCCTIFVPEHPIIKPRLEEVLKEETKCMLDAEIDTAYLNITKYELDISKKTNVFESKVDDSKFII